MNLIIDAQLPPALVDWLQLRGHRAEHVASSLGLEASDDDIWRLASLRRAAIMTKDRDFAIWASARRSGPQVVWIRLGNATTSALLSWLESRWAMVETRLEDGTHLIEVRS